MKLLLHRLTLPLLALLVALAAAPLAACAKDKDALADRAENAMWMGDIETLEALYADARSARGEEPWGGRTPIESVRAGMTEVLRYRGLDRAYFRELALLTARWAEQKPASPLRHLLHARVLLAYAWHVRGDGYWSSVPEPARAEFVRLVDEAERVIADHAALLRPDTTTAIYLVMIGRLANWPPGRTRAIVDDALSRTQVDAKSLLEEWAVTLLPKWQGDLDELAAVIDRYSRHVQPEHPDEGYAHLWSGVAFGIRGNLFRETRADWPRVRAGFRSLAGRLKNPYYRQRLAYLACLAQDRETTRANLVSADDADWDAWQGGGTGARQNLEACAAWVAGKP